MLLSVIGLISVFVVSCAYKGNVTLTTKDSFRFISPDFALRPRLHTEPTIDNDDEDNCNSDKKKAL